MILCLYALEADKLASSLLNNVPRGNCVIVRCQQQGQKVPCFWFLVFGQVSRESVGAQTVFDNKIIELRFPQSAYYTDDICLVHRVSSTRPPRWPTHPP
jgi:hypothetical protein